jgi:hypothetical protein
MGKKLLLRVLDGETDIISPYNSEGRIKHQYVLVDENDRMGYLLIWCDYTLNGINISRVKVPYNVPYIKIEDRANSDVPKIINFVRINPKIWY